MLWCERKSKTTFKTQNDITLFTPIDGVLVVMLRLKINDLDHFLVVFIDFVLSYAVAANKLSDSSLLIIATLSISP
jgi:hypothetical protein